MLIRIVLTLIVAMIAAFAFRVQLVDLLVWPLRDVDGDLATNLQSFGVTDAFTISFKLSFYAGLVISFPIILYFIANFIFPALTKKERRYMIPALLIGTALFLTGVFFCFVFLLRPTLQFFIADARKLGWAPNLSVVQYFSFVTQFTIAFGLSFELPVVVMLLVKLRILSHKLMANTRAYAVVAIIFLAAVITPTPDILTLLSLAMPLLVLYEICIWMAWLLERSNAKKAAAEAAEYDDPDDPDGSGDSRSQAALPPVVRPPGIEPSGPIYPESGDHTPESGTEETDTATDAMETEGGFSIEPDGTEEDEPER